MTASQTVDRLSCGWRMDIDTSDQLPLLRVVALTEPTCKRRQIFYTRPNPYTTKTPLDNGRAVHRLPYFFPWFMVMAFLNILRITLVSALLFTSASGVCVSPSVRREWRSISSDERAAWVNAVKVTSLSAQILSSPPDLGNSSVSPTCHTIPRSLLLSTQHFR